MFICLLFLGDSNSYKSYQTTDSMHNQTQALTAPGPSNTNSNNNSTASNSNSSSGNPPTKKIKRLIYEIGNLLSYVGISKDLNSQLRASSQQPQSTAKAATSTTPSVSRTASPQPSAPSTTPSSINIISPDENHIVVPAAQQNVNTRRSQFKKQTPSTIISSCSNHDMSELLDTNLDRNNPDFKQYRSKHRN